MIRVEIKEIELIAKERNVPIYVIIDEIVEKEMKKKLGKRFANSKK